MRNVLNAVREFGGICVNKIRRGGEYVAQKAQVVTITAFALTVALCGGSAWAEDTGALTLPTAANGKVMGIDWAGSVKNVIDYLSTNLTSVLGLAVGVVAIIVIFRWLTRGASGKA